MTVPVRERAKIPRQEMPVRDPRTRGDDFDEVALGFDADTAVVEATRCLECRRPVCIEGCPVGVRIDQFVPLVAAGDFAGAAAVVRQDNVLAAVCSRVCPQETQCEGACVLGRKHRPLAIGHLERFVADWARGHGIDDTAGPRPDTGRRVAVVGSGPAGLACAVSLARRGHRVTVFEALDEPGGVLAYGIPLFRLPRSVLEAEIDRVRALGVEIVTGTVIGLTQSLDVLLDEEGFEAIFVGTGAGRPRSQGIPGEELAGVHSATEFLARVNLVGTDGPGAETPVQDLGGAKVVVIGGGNTAFDAARTALRLGAASTRILYRRTRDAMPARAEEIEHATAEGVEIVPLVNPVEFIDSGDGRLCSVALVRMRLGEADASGRGRPEPIPGSEFVEDADAAIVAVGTDPSPMLRRSTAGLVHGSDGTITIDEETGATSLPGVFAGGDIVTGPATVASAIRAGHRAATAIDEWLRQGSEG